MTSKNEIRNQQKLQQNMCMGGKKRIREKNREQCIGRQRREIEKEKMGWNKVYGLSSLLNISKHTQS